MTRRSRFSSGKQLGPTKTGRARTVELSSRLLAELGAEHPDIYAPETLAFPGQRGQMQDPNNFRNRIFSRIVRRALGANRRVTPHTLRHTFASIHLSRGTNLLWVQQQGGWTSAKTLLDTYAHFLPSEVAGFADVLAAPDGTIRHHPSRATSPAYGTTRRKAKTSVPLAWRAREDSNLRPTDSKSVREFGFPV